MPADLLKEVDHAVYQSKRAGRNAVTAFSTESPPAISMPDHDAATNAVPNGGAAGYPVH